MAADSTYEIGKLANADAYVSDTLAGTGHLRVKVSPEGVKVDYVLAYLPADTLGQNKNRSIGFSYNVGGTTNVKNDDFSYNTVPVYPNPADKFITIDIPKSIQHQCSVVLTNTLGQVVYKGNEMIVNVELLPQGTYMLQYFVDNQQYVQQVIIHH
jgi:hypothetical protein